jgi:hypothetical protein
MMGDVNIYYLDVYSQRTTSRRKSVRMIFVLKNLRNFFVFRFKLFRGLCLNVEYENKM